MLRSFDAFAVTAPGLAALTAEELDARGIRHAPATADGIAFRADWRTLAAANLWLRTATRVLVRLSEFRALSFRELETQARRVPWGDVLAAGQPIALRVTCRKSKLYHSDAVAQRVRDAITHVLGVAPATHEVQEDDAEDGALDAEVQPLIVRVAHDVVTISACSSGVPLYKRGYRQAVSRAPLRETVAAACLLAVGYSAEAPEPFIDPLCGSGTMAIEAALLALRRAPGRGRGFAWTRWRGAPAGLLSTVIRETDADGLPSLDVPIIASDRSAAAVADATANAERAGVASVVQCRVAAVEGLVPPAPSGVWVSNAPYGQRLGTPAELRALFRQVGTLATGPFAGWRVALLLGDESHARQLGAETTRVLRTRVGGLQVGLYGVEGALAPVE